MQECIENCNETHQEALRALAWATSEGFENTTPEIVRLLADCAEICQTAANFMLRGSELHHETCRACEEVCEAVVEACEEAGRDEFNELRDSARACVDSCREMAHAGGRGPSEGNFTQPPGRGVRDKTTKNEPAREREAKRTTRTVRGAR